MEELNCVFCGIESQDVVIEENGYKGRKCRQCGLIFVSPRPRQNDILDLYGHDEAFVSAASHISTEFIKRLYAKHHLSIVLSYCTVGSILDIGAGAGFFLDEARKHGLKPFAVEFNKLQADYICNTLQIPCVSSPLSPSLFDNKRFDIVYHCDVISHFYDPISEFSKIHQVLKKDGILVFETGNLGDVHPKYFRFFEHFQYPDHLFFFSEQNLKDLLEQTGFELQKIHRYSILPQLVFLRLVRILTRTIKKQTSARADSLVNANQTSRPSTRSRNGQRFLKRLLRKTYDYINYAMRYSVGKMAPKRWCPQTLIVIAKRL